MKKIISFRNQSLAAAFCFLVIPFGLAAQDRFSLFGSSQEVTRELQEGEIRMGSIEIAPGIELVQLQEFNSEVIITFEIIHELRVVRRLRDLRDWRRFGERHKRYIERPVGGLNALHVLLAHIDVKLIPLKKIKAGTLSIESIVKIQTLMAETDNSWDAYRTRADILHGTRSARQTSATQASRFDYHSGEDTVESLYAVGAGFGICALILGGF